MKHTYDYPRPAVTTDCVALRFSAGHLKLVLIQRAHKPFKNAWALPGGFLDMDEDLKTCVCRELEEETGITNVFVEQIKAYGTVDRDPRGRTVSVAFLGLMNPDDSQLDAGDDASDAQWFRIDQLPKLAFDHGQVIKDALALLRTKVRSEPIGFELLPKKFPLRDLQRLYEIILDQSFDKRNFRRRILDLGVLVDVGQVEKNSKHRAAKLYRFDRKKYKQMKKNEVAFKL
ncbi:MAG: NUDIX hydrolase [Planctomycetaceae bacterium]|nr:NUDIX hydrolase [Planctomycetaceae bacterium]